MECVNHPGVAAASLCTRCDKPLCEACREERNGKPFCAPCAAFLDRRRSQRPPRPQTGAVPIPPQGEPVPQGDVFQGGDVYQGAPASASPSAAPFATTPTPPPARDSVFAAQAAAAESTQPAAGDVYEGPGDVYQGPGDVYQGGAAGVYQGPPGGAAATEPTGGETAAFKVVPALLFSAIAGFLAMFIWYQVAVTTGKEYGLIALLVGAMVGFGCRLGAGVADERAGLLAVAVFLVAVFAGKYLMVKSWYYSDMEEMAAYEESVADIAYDCDFTDDEARSLLGIEPDEWTSMNREFRTMLHRSLEAECQEESEYADYEEEYESDAGADFAIMQEPTFGQLIGDSFGTFGFVGMILVLFGVAEAYKIASTEAGAD